jgi:hypothetical protein
MTDMDKETLEAVASGDGAETACTLLRPAA